MSRPTILVTGATGGIGSAACRRLAANNLHPIITYRANKKSIAHTLAIECNGTALPLELADHTSIELLIDEVARMPNDLLGVVHCASPPPILSPFNQISERDMQLFWQVNVIGAHHLFAGIVKKSLRKLKCGHIVALTSQAMGSNDQPAMAGMGAYTISKFGLSGVLALLSSEFKWLNVVTISPGFTQTKMLEVFDTRFLEQMSAKASFQNPDEIATQILSHFIGK